MLKPKVGDLVRMKPMKIDGVVHTENRVSVTHNGGCLASFEFDEIEEILPRPLAVGDRVRFVDACGDGNILTILAIDGEEAWVKWRSGNRNGQLLSVLRRIDPS